MFGLIANAMAGGLAGGGQAAERGFARLGETQARMDLEQLRGQIETDRQAALARLQSELRRGDARAGKEIDLEFANRDRDAVRGIIEGATAQARDEQRPASEIRTRARGALADAGRLREAADYDKATEPPKLTTTTTPYGSVSTTRDETGSVVGTVDNASDIRAENERTRAAAAGRGRAPRALDQAGLDRIHDQATKFADRLAGERPHPFPDPTASGRDAAKDGAMVTLARTYMTRALTRAAQSGELVSPADLENLFRAAVDKADERVIASAEKEAGAYFDDKGRPRTGADAAMKEWGIRGAVDRESFLRAYRDKYLAAEMRAVLAEGAGRGAQPAAGRDDGGERPAARTEPPVTEGERPDDAARLANRPTGLIGGAAKPGAAPVSSIADPDLALLEREQGEIDRGERTDFSPEAKAVIARMDAEKQRGNDAMKARMQQQDIERSRAAARAARGG